MANKVTPPQKPRYPKKAVYTKIVGTTFENRQTLLASAKKHNVTILKLVRDYENEYDPDAVAVEAPIFNAAGVEIKSVRLGFLSNSHRLCILCGSMIDGATFSRSRLVKCPACGKVSQYTDAGDFTCDCGEKFDVSGSKTIVCPTCSGDEWVRDGFASQIARALEDGMVYSCRVTEFTGGDVNPKTGKMKTMGCNIIVEPVQAETPLENL